MNQPGRVVFVNRYFHPDHSATSQIASDLAFHLARRGWNVAAITSRQRYDDPRARLESGSGIESLQDPLHSALDRPLGHPEPASYRLIGEPSSS